VAVFAILRAVFSVRDDIFFCSVLRVRSLFADKWQRKERKVELNLSQINSTQKRARVRCTL